MSESFQDQKSCLRRAAMERRRAAGEDWRLDASGRIAEHVLAHPLIQSASNVAAFVSFGHEVSSRKLIMDLIALKGAVALPCTDVANRRLDFRRVSSFPEGFVKGFGGILEPDPAVHPELLGLDAIDCFLVPGLLFDGEGQRLGYGGGYYDRVLARRAEVPAVALAFGFQIVDALPHEPHDLPIGYICTEEGFVFPPAP